MQNALFAWIVFYLIIITLLVFDLGFLHKKNRKISFKESLLLSAGYILISMLFGLVVFKIMGKASMVEYYTGFLIEKTLAIDNIFLIIMIFSFMKIDEIYQHKVLFWGILGVIFMRLIMITIGLEIVHKFELILYFFSGFLIFVGIKIFTQKENNENYIKNNKFMKFLKKIIPHTDEIKDSSFFVKKIDPITKKKQILATPLFLALIFIEFIDLVFAIDSLPAIFAITTNKYVIYTSNIFAILGLRALYFAILEMRNRFKYLKYALGILMMFVGSKIFIAKIFGLEKFPVEFSLIITVAIIGTGIIFSLYKTKSKKI